MKREVRFAPKAVRDIHRLSDFVAEMSPSAAIRVVERLRAAAKTLATLSERGRQGPAPALRELVVRFGKGAYVIQYRIDAATIVVARIWHAREDRRQLDE